MSLLNCLCAALAISGLLHIFFWWVNKIAQKKLEDDYITLSDKYTKLSDSFKNYKRKAQDAIDEYEQQLIEARSVAPTSIPLADTSFNVPTQPTEHNEGFRQEAIMERLRLQSQPSEGDGLPLTQEKLDWQLAEEKWLAEQEAKKQQEALEAFAGKPFIGLDLASGPDQTINEVFDTAEKVYLSQKQKEQLSGYQAEID